VGDAPFDQYKDLLLETFFPMQSTAENCQIQIDLPPSNNKINCSARGILPFDAISLSGEDYDVRRHMAQVEHLEKKIRLIAPDAPAVVDHNWHMKYEELYDFHKRYGHCLVPNVTPDGISYQSLSQWVRRQRHQYKRKRLGNHSPLTDDRVRALSKLRFVWDSHGAAWDEKYQDLLTFKESRGHCNVPTEFPENQGLSIWVKCQRRQYKLYLTGKKNNICMSRISKLNDIGFIWNPRNLRL
jgi:Helicase associated domain